MVKFASQFRLSPTRRWLAFVLLSFSVGAGCISPGCASLARTTPLDNALAADSVDDEIASVTGSALNSPLAEVPDVESILSGTGSATAESDPNVVAVSYQPIRDVASGESSFGEDVQPSIDTVVQTGLYYVDIIDRALAKHPLAMGAARRIEQAQADLALAGRKGNPEFVFDIETPLHDRDDATEISTRLTFPIGETRNRLGRAKAAKVAVAQAISMHQAVLDQIAHRALSAAIRVRYLQERVSLAVQQVQIARKRLQLLTPENRPGNPGQNLLDQVDAQVSLNTAIEDQFMATTDLVKAQIDLAEAMGMDLEQDPMVGETILVADSLYRHEPELPPLSEVVRSAIDRSAELDAMQRSTDQAWVQWQNRRNEMQPFEAGPLYQDRLGRDDDTAGIRLQTDFIFDSRRRDAVRQAAFGAGALEGDYAAKRHEIAAATARAYGELQTLIDQMTENHGDDFVRRQTELLESDRASSVLTLEQRLSIEQLILNQMRERLEREYRCATLRSQLHLDVDFGTSDY